METEKSRSESPFSRNKTKSHLSDASEIGNTVIEQIKTKKKSLRNKSKSQANGKENEEIANNGKNFNEEKVIQNEIEKSIDSCNTDCKNGIENDSNGENNKDNEETPQQEMTGNDKKNDALINVCEISEEKIVNESNSMTTENSNVEEFKSTEIITTVKIEENYLEQCNNMEITETESSAKKNNSTPHDSMPELEVVHENFEEFCQENKNINTTVKEQEATEEHSDVKESSQTSTNESDGSSHYEEANGTEDHSQASPDTATKDDFSVSVKFTNFLGKWGYSEEQKLESEVSSSKKIEGAILNHFYLSKVSGRRGIKDRLNSSATVFSSKEMEAKTPENSEISLDDSFRVRTNPPCLNSFDLKENPILRKFKGKRCLNAGDEPEEEEEEEEDMYFNMVKRRKLDEKTQDSGLLKSILWSPFKKKSFTDKYQLKFSEASESKLSRLLSPFWFWKKTGTGQKEK